MNEALTEAFAQAGRAFDAARSGAVGVSSAELLAGAAQTQRAMNALAATQVVRIAQFACRGMVKDQESGMWSDHDFGIGHVAEFAGCEVGPALGMSPGTADRRVRVAATLARKLPRTLAAMAAGDLDWARAAVIAEELAEASVATCAAVEELIFDQVLGDTPARARNRVRRALVKVDPEALREKAAKARLQRGIRQWASDLPGMTEWAVTLPAADAAKCWAAIDALAHQRHGDDPGTSLEQCRADALVGLLLGQAEVETTVTFLFPVQPTADGPARGNCDGLDSHDSWSGATDHSAPQTDDYAGWSMADLYDRFGDDRDSAWPGDADWADWEAELRDRRDPHTAEAHAAPQARDAGDASEAPAADGVLAGAPRSGVAGVAFGCTGGPGGTGYTSMGPGCGMLHPVDEYTTSAAPGTCSVPASLRAEAGGCEIPGIGIIPADVVADLAGRFDTRVTRALLDPATGTVIETGCTTYRPHDRIAAHVRLRDGTCRFPGCARQASRCDQHHVIPWPHGPTRVDNLVTLCRHHHRTRHEGGWRLIMTPAGVCTWTSPLGQDYVTEPVDHRTQTV